MPQIQPREQEAFFIVGHWYKAKDPTRRSECIVNEMLPFFDGEWHQCIETDGNHRANFKGIQLYSHCSTGWNWVQYSETLDHFYEKKCIGQ